MLPQTNKQLNGHATQFLSLTVLQVVRPSIHLGDDLADLCVGGQGNFLPASWRCEPEHGLSRVVHGGDVAAVAETQDALLGDLWGVEEKGE